MAFVFCRVASLLATSLCLCAVNAHAQPAAPDRQDQATNQIAQGMPLPSEKQNADASALAADAAKRDTDPQINGSIKDAIPSGAPQK
ncbi:MAG: hypothetical protein PGN26_00170 [Xylophilus ampelinus]